MAFQQSDVEYPVVITRCADGFELSICELLVTVRAANLSEGWKILIDRQREVMEWAAVAGLLDELPPPQPPPLLLRPFD